MVGEASSSMRYCVGERAKHYLAAAEEVGLLDVVGIHAGGDADHPQELVDVVAAVADEASEDDEDVVHVQTADDRVRLLLAAGERLRVRGGTDGDAADGGDVRVVPGVVVHDDRAVAHAGHLLAVVPPTHELGVLVRVLTHPVVGFAVVVEDGATAVTVGGGYVEGLQRRYR